MASRPRSLVWNHFTISVTDDSRAIFNHCNESALCGGRNPKTYGTTNLLKHLGFNHKSDYSTLQAEEAAQVKEPVECKVAWYSFHKASIVLCKLLH